MAEFGKDCVVRDVDGNEFIDFNSGIAVLNVGHGHPRVVEAIEKQSRQLIHYSWTDFYYEAVVELAERLSKITPGSHHKKCFFGNSGAEAVEAAIKLTKWHTRRQLFLSYIGGFHGRTTGALSFTAGKPAQRRHFFPLMPGVTHVPFAYCYRCPFKLTYPECDLWCVDFIEEQVLKKYVPPEDVAAFFIEPIQGEAGYIVPPAGYFERLQKILGKYGILLVDDEVQAGMGRTGRWFGIEHWNVTPDVVCVSKSLGGGLPIGAIVSKAELMDWDLGAHATTLGGNPVACAAGIEVIKIIQDERLLENAARQGNYLVKRFREIQEKQELIGDVRGKGLMVGVELVKDRKKKTPAVDEAKRIIKLAFRRGLAAIMGGASTIRIAPPLTITKELVEAGIEILEDVIKQVQKESEGARL